MSPRLRILAGTSLDSLVPITDLVNTPTPFELSSDSFQGKIVANIKGLQEEDGSTRDSEYFEREDRSGITWSIQVQGRFLEPLSADDILFGNIFDRPLQLPWGTSAVLKFMYFIDPSLEHDLMSTKPWALSPLISTMPHFAHKRLGDDPLDAEEPAFPPTESLEDSMQELHLTVVEESHSSASSSASSSRRSTPASSSSSLASVSSTASKNTTGSKRSSARSSKKSSFSSRSHNRQPSLKTQILELGGASQRKSFFSQENNRKAVIFGPEDIITTDFCYGFINFTPTLSLQLPAGLSFDLVKYWDGQPVRFVCCKRKEKDETDGDPWGKILWCMAIELVEES